MNHSALEFTDVTCSFVTPDGNHYTAVRDVNLTISGIKATCKASLFAKKSTTLKIKLELQKKKSDGYETVETWTKSGNGLKLDLLETRNINRLCKYRIKATFTAGSEKEIVYQY